jgi:hypothetical protein
MFIYPYRDGIKETLKATAHILVMIRSFLRSRSFSCLFCQIYPLEEFNFDEIPFYYLLVAKERGKTAEFEEAKEKTDNLIEYKQYFSYLHDIAM